MNIVAIIGVVIVIAVMSVTLKKYVPEFSMMVNIVTGVIVLSVIMCHFLPAVYQIKDLLFATKLPKEYGTILFKSLGVCFLTQFASDACKDAGENSLASKVELAGKIAILLIALPLFEKITKIAISLIGGS